MSEKKIEQELNQEVKFTDFKLRPEILKALADVGYEVPSPIQAQAIPQILAGHDLLGVAQTGTGKTAAFALPMLSRINEKLQAPQLLVLAPTRELAIQVAEAFQKYAKYLNNFHVLPIYGGQDYKIQLKQLARGAQVIVGTPGTVMDHMRRGTLKLDNLQALVLDEADEMLRMGFIDDVEWILQEMPEFHQTALFSATMPSVIKRLTNQYLKNPVDVTIKVKTTTAETISQKYWQLRPEDKIDTLTRVLEVEETDGVIIFVRTKNETLEVAEKLQARGFAAEALNGDIVQKQREKIVGQIKKGQIDILVATDVAARGLDVERISHVINYDIPYDTESYVHRIGRTGRAGREGVAILFVTSRELRMLSMIERATKQKIDKYQPPSIELLNQRKIEQLFSQINEALEGDLTDYHGALKRFQQEYNVSPLDLAAALAFITQEGKPLLLKESEFKQPRFTEEPRRSGHGGGGGRDRDRSGRSQAPSDARRGFEGRKKPAVANQGNKEGGGRYNTERFMSDRPKAEHDTKTSGTREAKLNKEKKSDKPRYKTKEK